MEFEGLEQYQINMIFSWCDMSGIHDINRARTALQECGWHLESAINRMVEQFTPAYERRQEKEEKERMERERKERQEAAKAAEILRQQNLEYEKMQKQITKKAQEEANTKAKLSYKEELLREGQKEFENRPVEGDPITIKFRMPNKVAQFTFSQKDTVQTVFKYVSFCQRDGFEKRFGNFDLTQPVTNVSLRYRREETLGDVFEGSTGEVLTLKEE